MLFTYTDGRAIISVLIRVSLIFSLMFIAFIVIRFVPNCADQKAVYLFISYFDKDFYLIWRVFIDVNSFRFI